MFCALGHPPRAGINPIVKGERQASGLLPFAFQHPALPEGYSSGDRNHKPNRTTRNGNDAYVLSWIVSFINHLVNRRGQRTHKDFIESRLVTPFK